MNSCYRSTPVIIGELAMGGNAPVRIQTMTNTSTHLVESSLAQCRDLIRRGAELVRLTVQGNKELTALSQIRSQLYREGISVPLVADIHFRPRLALEAAGMVEKIRINPGNYLRGNALDTLLPELLDRCAATGTAIRIGVNHGSLHPSILEEHGDTPMGMVESAMQFLRICRDRRFERVVVSLKASNPRVMVQSVRLLVRTMTDEGISYPLHLGVTEAGDGPEGRIRSAVGLAPLLLEGMGDTIRVSLTEPPSEELPVASALVSLFPKPDLLPYDPLEGLSWNPFSFHRRVSLPVGGIGKGSKVKIISDHPPEPGTDPGTAEVQHQMVTYDRWLKDRSLLEGGKGILLLEQGSQPIQEIKRHLNHFCHLNTSAPVAFRPSPAKGDRWYRQLKLAGDVGSLLVDGAVDALWPDDGPSDGGPSDGDEMQQTLLRILQAAGARISHTEYIACPSCGRTHFDILSRLREVRSATSHLAGLKIAVMGCIVNGPGEMADADYGYVGAGPERVSIYKGKSLFRDKVHEKEALKILIGLMKQEGDWTDPPSGQ